MNIFSVFGLITAVLGLVKCTAGLTDDSMASKIAISFDLPGVLADKIKDAEHGIDLTPMNFVRRKVFDVLRDVYRKEVTKNQLAMEREEKFIAAVYNSSATIIDTNLTRHSNRVKRQAINVPIPTLLGLVPGPDDFDVDLCDRDEVLLDDGDCYELLDQGPCQDDYFVIMDPVTKKGLCAPRLCAPGKVFLIGDQLCHDPREAGLCPPGRMLFTSSFGTPLCGCPDGTYEEDDDLDDNVCEPILGQINNCPIGQVFWFTDFRSPPSCKPDPCEGVNLKRGPNDLPHVPALVDRKCYKIGTQPKFCRPDQFYSLSLKYLRGVCSSLDEAGYTILDDGDISALTSTFGNFISRDIDPFNPKGSSKPSNSFRKPVFSSAKPPRRQTKITPASTTLLTRPVIGTPVMKMDDDDDDDFHLSPILIGQSVVANYHPGFNEVDPSHPILALLPTHMNAFSTPLITVNGSTTMLGFVPGWIPIHHFGKRSSDDEEETNSKRYERSSSPVRLPRHRRSKRSPLPFASPGNVIEPGLTSCRAGAIRDINAKCRITVLPSRFPPSRPVRSVPAVRPRPSCPGGGFWGLGRSCSSSSSGIASIINRLGLG